MIDAMAALICAAVPEIVTVPLPLLVIVAPPPVTTLRMPEPAGIESVVASETLSTSATLTPEMTLLVSSLVTCAPGSVLTGASLIAVTVMLTFAVSVTPPEVTV